jgi:hypothetical protein
VVLTQSRFFIAAQHVLVTPGSFNLDDHLDLDRRVAGKRGHAYGGACMFADGLAKDFHHQIGKSIYYARLAAKTFS